MNSRGTSAVSIIRSAPAGPPRRERQGEHELERIDVEEHDEEQRGVHPEDDVVLQAVAPEKDIVLPPDHHEQPEADRERQESAHHAHELGEGLRHLERDDEERDGEREHGVGEALDARDLVSAPAEAVAPADALRREALAEGARHAEILARHASAM
jgi:hypothetical protein